MTRHELMEGGLVEAGSSEDQNGCLAEDSVLRLLAGELAKDQLEKAEEHLDSCVDCRRLVALAGAHLRSVHPSDSRPALSEELAEIIDGGLALESLRTIEESDYRVERALARGGMGRVLLALDRQARRVAIKMLLNPGKSAARRFLREMQITSALQLPSIVILHEAGRWPSGER